MVPPSVLYDNTIIIVYYAIGSKLLKRHCHSQLKLQLTCS